MSDDFIDIILGAVRQVICPCMGKDGSTSTIYRGGSIEVFDALKACFISSYRPGVHCSLEATLSKGCPGDVDGGYTFIIRWESNQ